jgi:hypothetical protein
MANGKCRVHGGRSTGPKNGTGFYSKTLREELRQKHDAAMDLANPLDTCEELAIDRMILDQFMANVVGQSISAEVANQITHMTGEIVRKASLMVKSRNDTALTIAELGVIQKAMQRLVSDEFFPDPDKRRAFLAGVRELLPGRDREADNADPDNEAQPVC